jgi:hypothetical protein
LKKRADFNLKVYGVFGYLKCDEAHYLILIEEASIVGQIANGIIYKVEKLKYISVNNASLDVLPGD